MVAPIERIIRSFEGVLEAEPHKTVAVRTLTSDLRNYPRRTRHAEHKWRRENDLSSDVLLWAPKYR